MIIRQLEQNDIPMLQAMHVTQGFSYDFPNLTAPDIEAALVVESDEGKILAAVAAERLVQLYFFCGDVEHPAGKMALIRWLHDHMATALRAKGYFSAEAFLPPQLDKTFGKRLERSFGWVKNWVSYSRRF